MKLRLSKAMRMRSTIIVGVKSTCDIKRKIYSWMSILCFIDMTHDDATGHDDVLIGDITNSLLLKKNPKRLVPNWVWMVFGFYN